MTPSRRLGRQRAKACTKSPSSVANLQHQRMQDVVSPMAYSQSQHCRLSSRETQVLPSEGH